MYICKAEIPSHTRKNPSSWAIGGTHNDKAYSDTIRHIWSYKSIQGKVCLNSQKKNKNKQLWLDWEK